MTDAQGTQLSAEAWVSPPGDTVVRATQLSAEAWVAIPPSGPERLTQASAEAWVQIHRPNLAWLSQADVEAWVTTRGLGLTYPVYPTLAGLGYSVIWRAIVAALPTQEAANLAQVDLALADTPVHEFELTYNVLRDESSYLGSGLTNEFRTFMGFFLRIQANVGRFVFENPYDETVTGEAVAVTDGVATDYGPLQRTFGVAPNVGVEPVGYVNTGKPYTVYLDGVAQAPGTFSFDRTIPCAQKLHFLLAPAAGKAITIDYSYYYYCKLGDDNMTFEAFMDRLWTVKKVTLRSNRAGA